MIGCILTFPILSGALIAETKISAYQFNQIYGWFGGNKRALDTSEEMNQKSYAVFWTMNEKDRQIAFNSFGWPVIEVLIDMELNEILALRGHANHALTAPPRVSP